MKNSFVFRLSSFDLQIKPHVHAQFHRNDLGDALFQFRDFNAFDDFVRERVHEQCLRLFLRNPARLHVKHRLVVELADGATVRTFDVVGKNFELRFGVDGRFVAEQNVVVLLECVGFLRLFFDKDFAIKNTCRRSPKIPL